MTRQVGLSVEALDNLIDLLKSLTEAATPPELPALDKRDKNLWRRAHAAAKRELKKALEKRKKSAVARPGFYRLSNPTAAQARAAKAQFNKTVRWNAERKYRKLDPALAEEGAKKAKAAQRIAAKLSDLLTWHRPALLKALSKYQSNPQETWDMMYSNAIMPVPDPDIAGYRDVVIQHLLTMRLTLEERLEREADVIKGFANKEEAHLTPAPATSDGKGKAQDTDNKTNEGQQPPSGNSAAKHGKRGRKGLVPAKLELYNDVVPAWNTAHETKVSKPDFVTDWNEKKENTCRQITLKTLENALSYRRKHRK